MSDIITNDSSAGCTPVNINLWRRERFSWCRTRTLGSSTLLVSSYDCVFVCALWILVWFWFCCMIFGVPARVTSRLSHLSLEPCTFTITLRCLTWSKVASWSSIWHQTVFELFSVNEVHWTVWTTLTLTSILQPCLIEPIESHVSC
jgi:hypothetical protein